MAVKYYDFIIKGNDDVIVAYLEGYLHGKGVREGYVFTEDLPFQKHFLKEFLEYHGDVMHTICRGTLRPVIRTAIRRGAERHRFELVESRPLKNSRFEFEFETANRKVAGRIKRLLGRLPTGTRLAEFEPEESRHPGAKGAEGYAPLHEYQYSGKGYVEGEVEGVLKAYRKFEDNDFVTCEEIELVF